MENIFFIAVLNLPTKDALHYKDQLLYNRTTQQSLINEMMGGCGYFSEHNVGLLIYRNLKYERNKGGSIKDGGINTLCTLLCVRDVLEKINHKNCRT